MKIHRIEFFAVFAFVFSTVFGFSSGPISAYADGASSFGQNDSIVAYLENEDGETTEVAGHRISQIQPNQIDNDAQITYAFAVTAADLGITKDQWDGSIAVHAFLTIRYLTQNNDLHVLLTSVNGHWEIADPSVRVTNVSLRYGCDDMSLFGRQAREISSVGNYFNYNTGFQTYAMATNGVVGANILMNLQHGAAGSTWTLYVKNNYCENFSSWFNTR